MADITQTFGRVVKSLPLDAMFSAPLEAVIQAQTAACKSTVGFIKEVGFDENGDAVMVRSGFTQQISDKEGNVVKAVKRVIDVPLLCLVPIPAVAIEEVKIGFELTVETAEAQSSETEGKGSVSGKVGWGPFSAKFSASMSHKSTSTRKTDTRARYTVDILAKQQPPAEGMSRMLETLLAAVQPIDASVADKLPASADAA